MIRNKKTKIVCTISDLKCDVDFIRDLYQEGMNVVRINSAHASLEGSSKILKNIREVSDRIAVLIDTKGPEVRLTELENPEGYAVKEGDLLSICNGIDQKSTPKTLFTNYFRFVSEIPVGSEILIDDGDLSLCVESKDDQALHCKVNNSGIIMGRKSINVPGVSINLPAITEKDKRFIEWAVDQEVDFVAHSFVRSKADLEKVNEIIFGRNPKSTLKIISKIENQEGVDNIEEILDLSYGIMIARGDLGIEIPAEKIPVIQKRMIKRCRIRKRPVIVATQMLHSMIVNPRPTRAEISDVASAVMSYTDAIMLSGETAYGKYPIEAVRTMTKVAIEVEAYHSSKSRLKLEDNKQPISAILAQSLVSASEKVKLRCIIIDTMTGRTGRYLSAYRPNVPIYAQCYRSSSVRALALSYGVKAKCIKRMESKEEFMQTALKSLEKRGRIDLEDTVGVLCGSFGASTGASLMEIATVKDMHKIIND